MGIFSSLKKKAAEFFGYDGKKLLLILLLILVSLFYRTSQGLEGPLHQGNTDTTYYHETAVIFYNSWQFSGGSENPPGYPVLLGLLYHLTGPYFFYSKIFSPIFSVLLSIMTFHISKKIFKDNRMALFAMLLLLFDPEINFYSSGNYKEASFIFLILFSIGMHLHLRGQPENKPRTYLFMALQSLAIVFATYTNPWVLLFIPVFALDYYIFEKEQNKTNFFGINIDTRIADAGRYFFSMLLLTFVLMVPWVLMMWYSTGGIIFLPSNSGYLLYFSNNPSPYSNIGFTSNYPEEMYGPLKQWVKEKNLDYNLSDSLERNKASYQFALDYIISNPGTTISHIFGSMGYLLFPNVEFSQRTITDPASLLFYLYVLWFLSLGGLYFFFKMPADSKRGGAIILIIILVIVAIYIFPPYIMRFKTYLLPFFVIISGVFVSRINWLWDLGNKAVEKFGTIVILLLSILVIMLANYDFRLWSIHNEVSHDGIYVNLKKDLLSSGGVLLADSQAQSLLHSHFYNVPDLIISKEDLPGKLAIGKKVFVLASSLDSQSIDYLSKSYGLVPVLERSVGYYQSLSIYADQYSFEESLKSYIYAASGERFAPGSITLVKKSETNIPGGRMITYQLYVNSKPVEFTQTVLLLDSGEVLSGVYPEGVYLIEKKPKG